MLKITEQLQGQSFEKFTVERILCNKAKGWIDFLSSYVEYVFLEGHNA